MANVDTRQADACRAIRIVERYLYKVLSEAEEGSIEARKAQDIMRLAVGIRRKLDAEETR